MSFITDIQKLPDLKEFEGGNNKQRDHLNALVKAIKLIRDAANRAGNEKSPNVLQITVVANGAPVDGTFTAYVGNLT